MSLAFPDDLTYITPAALRLRAPSGRYDPGILRRWREQGRIEKLRNGLYRNTAVEERGPFSLFSNAAQMYDPSYVSLHMAMRIYNFIPETVYEVTSISLRKTVEFQRRNARYSYRQIKPRLFFGFETGTWQGETYHLAHPEKALIDMAYFFPDFDDPDWIYEMRFDEHEINDLVDWNRMDSYLDQAESPSLRRRIDLLFESVAA